MHVLVATDLLCGEPIMGNRVNPGVYGDAMVAAFHPTREILA
jgi:hypothetical protein